MSKNKELDISSDIKSKILNKHSGLTTMKIFNDDGFSVNFRKIIWTLFSKEQEILKANFSIGFKSLMKEMIYFYDLVELDELFENIYNDKKIDFSKYKINYDAMFEIIDKIIQYKVDKLKDLVEEKSVKKFLIEDLSESYITKIYLKRKKDINLIDFIDKYKANNFSKKELEDFSVKDKKKNIFLPDEFNKFDNNQLNEIVTDIKNFCKQVSIEKSAVDHHIDFTDLCNQFDMSLSRVKKDIIDNYNTQVHVNHVNKKNINVDTYTTVLSSVSFIPNKKNTFMKYEISRRMLELLILPEIYVKLEGVIISQIKNSDTMAMYELLKDHILRGTLTLTKEEFFDLFKVSEKCKKNKYDLEQRVLIPIMSELKTATDIEASYEFNPKSRWKEIIFQIKHNKVGRKNAVEKITIKTNKDEKLSYKDFPNIVYMVEKARRNIFVNRYWKKPSETKVNTILNTYGENFTVYILSRLYKELSFDIDITLVAFINNIIKSYKDEVKADKKKLTKLMLNKETDLRIKNLTLENEFKNELPKIESTKIEKQEKKVEKNSDSNKIETKTEEKIYYEKQYLDKLISEIDEEIKMGRISKIKYDEKLMPELFKRYEALGKNVPIAHLLKKFIKEGE